MKTSETDIKPGIRRIFRCLEGVASVEMALVLPFLLVLVLGLYEFSRAIAINNVITNMSREGANLAARTGSSPEDIMNALAETASQLNMQDNGIIYLTRALQTNTGPPARRAKVLEQFRWEGSTMGDPPASQVWICDNPSRWDGGECDIIPDLHSETRTANLDMTLNDNEEVVAVEVYYVYRPAFQVFLKKDLPLYSLTLL
jgi:hypothetical protein